MSEEKRIIQKINETKQELKQLIIVQSIVIILLIICMQIILYYNS